MARAVAPPTIPDAWLADSGWKRTTERTETVFEGLGVTVESHTYIYEDTQLRGRIVAAGGADRVWRFFFTSGLTISPSSGLGMESVAMPHAVRESRKSFAEELRERGFEDIEQDDTQRIRLQSGTNVRLTPHRARLSVDGRDIDIRGAIAVWYDGAFYTAGGAFPTGLEPWVDIDADAFENELLELIQTVA